MLARRISREFKGIEYNISEFKNEKIIKFVYLGKKITAVLSRNYPFSPPNKLYINNRLIDHKYFNNFSLNIKKRLNKTYGKDLCFMCRSLLCSENWRPSVKLKHVVEEILGFRNIIVRAHYAEYIKKYGILPFPEEITSYILDYV